jgi:predicted amidohydrolase YtcJ
MPAPDHAPSARVSRRGFLVAGAVGGGALLAGAAPGLAAGRGKADLVLRDGFVWTLDRSNPVARAVAVRGGRIAYAGGVAGVRELIGPRTEVVELGGRMVMPGIHDGHIHSLSGGRSLTAFTLNYEPLTLNQFLERLAGFLAQSSDQEPDGWLRVTLWDATAMGGLPTRDDLDTLDTARPIIVISLDGHIAVANSRALDIAGITASTPDPPGGEIRKDASGRPTGVLIDAAIGLVTAQIPAPTVEENAEALAAGLAEMARQGITSYLEASSGDTYLAAAAVLADAGRLTARAHAALTVDAELGADPAAALEYVEGLRAQYARPGIEIDNVKLFFDGVIEYPTQTAALLWPYRVNEGTEEDPRWVPGDSRGPTYFPPAIADPLVTALDGAGWQVHMHAIGDRAVRSALDAVAAARRANGARDNRHTLTHLELITPPDFERFSRLGVLASMQMQWAQRDAYTMDYLKDYIGRRRWLRLYAAGSLWNAGARVCGGSDWPVDPLLPFRQIEMAVNRTADEVYGGHPEPLNRDEAISLYQSIRMHTRNSAFQLHQERRTGMIRAGMAADLAVLDRNLLRVDLTDVSTTKVLMTTVGGRVVHRAEALSG